MFCAIMGISGAVFVMVLDGKIRDVLQGISSLYHRSRLLIISQPGLYVHAGDPSCSTQDLPFQSKALFLFHLSSSKLYIRYTKFESQ